MFKINEGGLDRTVRIIAGLIMLAGFFLMPEATYRWAFLIGVIPLATGIVGSCPVYSVFGISTCSVKRV